MVKIPNTSGNNEWYTPPWVLDLARGVLGGEFDLDPASSAIANQTVRATRFFTQEDDALTRAWYGDRVWMNPPYSAGLFPKFANKLIFHRLNEHIESAAVLTNNTTESAAGQLLLGYADAVLFLNKRIRFLGPDGKPGESPRFGQMMCFFGEDLDYSGLSAHGTLMVRD